MSDAAARSHHPAAGAEVAAWFAVVAALSVVLPVLPIALAVALAFTRLRDNSPTIRIGLVALAVVILAFQLAGLQGGHMTGTTSKPVTVTING